MKTHNLTSAYIAYFSLIAIVLIMALSVTINGCQKEGVTPALGQVPKELEPYEVVALTGSTLMLRNGDKVELPLELRQAPDSVCVAALDSLLIEDGGRWDILKYFAFKGGYAYLIKQERRVEHINYDTDPKNLYYTLVWSTKFRYPSQSFHLTCTIQ